MEVRIQLRSFKKRALNDRASQAGVDRVEGTDEAPRDLQAQGASISQMTGGRVNAEGVGLGGGRWSAVMAEHRCSKRGVGQGRNA